MEAFQLRQILVEICCDTGADDLEKLKFLLRDVTGSAKLEVANMAIDLFSAIENNKHVSLHDGRYLAECFCLIGRQDLVRKLKLVPSEIEETMLTECRLLPFRVLLFKISEDIDSKEFDKMKFYCSKTLGFRKRQLEKAKDIFDLFVLLEKGTFISPTSTSVLKEILRSLDRGDLLDLIDEYQEKNPQMMDSESVPDSAEFNGSNGRLIPITSEPPSADMNRSEYSTGGQFPVGNPGLPENVATNIKSPIIAYEMTAHPRGYCVIINNNNFIDFRPRMGTDIDAKNLYETFHKLGFQVKEFRDLKAKDMIGVMIDLSKLDHSKYNALVVCILSHGGEHVVYGSDDQKVTIRHLTTFFKSSKCKSLANKPKLFFIQACQGEEKQRGIDQRDLSIQTDGPSENNVNITEEDTITVPSNNEKEIIPDESDFLIGHATVTGYASFRSRSKGSFYIRKLTENLNKYADSLDLISILTRVNDDVANENIPAAERREINKQVPMPQFTLRKHLFFNPDNLPPARTITQPSDAPLNAEGM